MPLDLLHKPLCLIDGWPDLDDRGITYLVGALNALAGTPKPISQSPCLRTRRDIQNETLYASDCVLGALTCRDLIASMDR